MYRLRSFSNPEAVAAHHLTQDDKLKKLTLTPHHIRTQFRRFVVTLCCHDQEACLHVRLGDKFFRVGTTGFSFGNLDSMLAGTPLLCQFGKYALRIERLQHEVQFWLFPFDCDAWVQIGAVPAFQLTRFMRLASKIYA